MTENKKIKIHVKNNHWAPGSFPTDAEGEKNFTITKEHLENALEDLPEIKDKIEIFVDWDEDNFEKSMAMAIDFSKLSSSQSTNISILSLISGRSSRAFSKCSFVIVKFFSPSASVGKEPGAQ